MSALPVMDESGHFIGEYARWDCLLAADRYINYIPNKYAAKFWESKSGILLVRPSDIFLDKTECFLKWKQALEKINPSVTEVLRTELEKYWEEADLILFSDEDEKRGTIAVYRDMCGKSFPAEKVFTYKEIGRAADEAISTSIEDVIGEAVVYPVLEHIQQKGINVRILNFLYDGSDYCKTMHNEIEDRYAKIGQKRMCRIYKEWYKDFFDDLYSEEYVKEILMQQSFPISKIDGIIQLKDRSLPRYTVIEGERLTVDQPDTYLSSIYFFGPCVMVGQFVEDKYTIESYLQQMLNDAGRPVRVVNYGCWSNTIGILNRVVNTKLRKNDTVILYIKNKLYQGVSNINLIGALKDNNIPSKWLVDAPVHGNHKVNRVYAEALYKELEEITSKSISGETVELEGNYMTKTYIERFFQDFEPKRYGKIGAIVMNCNPFTQGHRYLIEQALNCVDYLIIFVVQEDKSLFTFEERFAGVCAGTSDLPNVKVVPSGGFILSQKTFPEYFLKIVDEEIQQNTEYDITLFAEQIAPQLNISYRFVGEELSDVVTNEYNNAMKKILPEYGIQLIEIPRKQTEKGTAISATTVRGYIDSRDISLLSSMIPNSTLQILYRENK